MMIRVFLFYIFSCLLIEIECKCNYVSDSVIQIVRISLYDIWSKLKCVCVCVCVRVCMCVLTDSCRQLQENN